MGCNERVILLQYEFETNCSYTMLKLNFKRIGYGKFYIILSTHQVN